jgi:hypothetical protein
MPMPVPATFHSSPAKLVPVPKYCEKLPRTLLSPVLSFVPKARVKP